MPAHGRRFLLMPPPRRGGTLRSLAGWIGAALLLGAARPVTAGDVAVSCFLRNHVHPQGEEIPCRGRRRLNHHGHVVYDFAWEEGQRSTLVFWKDGRVESIGPDLEGRTEVQTGYFLPADGGIEVVLSHGSTLYLKGLDPERN
jgi:hypothetical protein